MSTILKKQFFSLFSFRNNRCWFQRSKIWKQLKGESDEPESSEIFNQYNISNYISSPSLTKGYEFRAPREIST